VKRKEEFSLIPRLTRRQFFRVGATTFAGYTLLPIAKPLQVRAAEKIEPRGSAEFCIFLFLMGGPPQLDTFDVKEGKWTPSDFDIRTITPEVRMPVALFPKLSEKRRLDQMLFARSVEAWESVHERGQYYIQAGRAFSGARAKEIPSVGSLVAYEFDSKRRSGDFMPPFVAMNFSPGGAGLAGPGMLPATFAPLPIAVQKDGDFSFVVPEEERARFSQRWEFLQRMDRSLRSGEDRLGRPLLDYHDFYLGAYEMMKRPEVGKILKFSDEEHQKYGKSSFGDACLLARNLVNADAGTRFIAIAQDGWDLHANVYDKSKPVNHYTLCRDLDFALAGLLDDLSSTRDKQGRTLLDKTFIVCMGEFGRTPGDINANKGRDHYRYASTTVFAGGGVKGGRVLGSTDDVGGKVIKPGWHQDRSIYTEDVMATIFSTLGIDFTKKITNTPSGREFEYVEITSGTDFISPSEIKELFG
jgi:Protein of unknown function (DUF1501)